MIIAYRPTAHNSRDFTCTDAEYTLASKDAGPGKRVRHVILSERGSPSMSAVVFRCYGETTRVLSKDTNYTHFVELSPEEIICGLSALPPQAVREAIKAVLKESRSALEAVDACAFSDNLSSREIGLPSASDIIECSNAIARGVVEHLSNNRVDAPRSSNSGENRTVSANEGGLANADFA